MGIGNGTFRDRVRLVQCRKECVQSFNVERLLIGCINKIGQFIPKPLHRVACAARML